MSGKKRRRTPEEERLKKENEEERNIMVYCWKSTHSPGVSTWKMTSEFSHKDSPKAWRPGNRQELQHLIPEKNLLNLPLAQGGVLFRNNPGGIFKIGGG